MNSVYHSMALPDVNTHRIQWIAIAGSIALLGVIFQLVRRHRLRVEYSLLWFACGLLFFCLSFWRSSLDALARAVGVAYAPAALLLILVMGLYALALHYSIVISRLSQMCVSLTQELAILDLTFKIHQEKDHQIEALAQSSKPSQE